MPSLTARPPLVSSSLTVPYDYGANPAASVRAIQAMLAEVAASSATASAHKIESLRRRFGDAPKGGGVGDDSPNSVGEPVPSSRGLHVGGVEVAAVRASPPRADFVAHSYGTLAVAHMLKQAGECVRSATLIDPVCVGAHRATLCRSFL